MYKLHHVTQVDCFTLLVLVLHFAYAANRAIYFIWEKDKGFGIESWVTGRAAKVTKVSSA